MRFRSLGMAFSKASTPDENNLLLIRMMAATFVLLGHSFVLAPLSGGMGDPFLRLTHYVSSHILGVQIFFLISGFLVTASWDRRANLKGFLAARLLRLWPGLAACVLTTVFLMGPWVTQLKVDDYLISDKTLSYAFWNISLMGFENELPGVRFNPGLHGSEVNGGLWTISLESRLYLGVAVFGMMGLFRRPIFGIPILGALTVVLVTEGFSLMKSTQDGSGYLLAAFFTLGSLLYLVRHWIRLSWLWALVLILLSYLSRDTPYHQISSALFASYAVFVLGFGPKIPLPIWLEDYSYGMYLYGFPIQQLLTLAMDDVGPFELALASIPMSMVAGALSWHGVEKASKKASGPLFHQVHGSKKMSTTDAES